MVAHPQLLSPDEARPLFPVTERWTYLDHAAVSPISRPVYDAMTRQLSEVLHDGDTEAEGWDRMICEVRQSAARLLGCRPGEVAFLKNTSEGINLVAKGLDWREGDNVVSAEGEFPANVYPWMSLARRGVELRQVQGRDGRLLLADIREAMDERTRVLALSFVEFLSGFRNDVVRLGQLCKERGILFSVDAIQGLGALRFDVEEANVDFASADAHKWLLGPEGIALFYCRKDRLEMLGDVSVGWASVRDFRSYLEYDYTLRDEAARYELGTTNTVGLAGLGAAIRLLQSVGPEAIEGRIKELTDRLCRGVAALGAEVLSSRQTGEWSGIVSFKLPGADHEKLHGELRRRRFVLSLRSGWLRAAPHFYNSPEEIDRLLESLRALR